MTDSASLFVSAGSGLVALVALWRSGRVRVLDRRTELLRDLADLRPRLEALERAIPAAVQSRVNASAAMGAMGGRLEVFKRDATHDIDTVKALRTRAQEIARIPFLTTYAIVEAKLVAAQEIRTQYDQLSEKYAEAGREDASTRAHLRERMNTIVAANIVTPQRQR